jgi:Lon protease-like protein
LIESATHDGAVLDQLALFPMQSVLFPGGVLKLKVFEARYLDLVSQCLRDGAPFGVVCISRGSEVRVDHGEPLRFESVGVLARLDEVDAEQAGVLRVSCRGGRRFEIGVPGQRSDGLWSADARLWPEELPVPVPPELAATRVALSRAIASLQAQGHRPFAEPYALDDAGWVANRWCEILPIPRAAKQKLMALDEPTLRLKLVDEYLRGKGVV